MSGGFERARNIIQIVMSLKKVSTYPECTKIPKYQKGDVGHL
jgi:hypothetical protein